jgi:Cu-Zn family superoxide dismutase
MFDSRILATLMTLLLAIVLLKTGPAMAADAAEATLQDREGRDVGNAVLRQTPNGVLLHIKLAGLPAGTHALHIHETGVCETPFKSAGGHYAPKDAKHGYLNEEGPHAGDLPNIHVPQDGVLELEIMTGVDALKSDLLDDDGAAIVIHEGADDYETDPAGDAESRIACGVIKAR